MGNYSMKLLNKRLILGLSIGCILLGGVGLTWLYHAAPFMIVKPFRRNFAQTPAQGQLPMEAIAITTQDSLTLYGFWVHRAGKVQPTVVLVHGIGSCKEHWLPTAAWLHSLGYDALLLDNRAHGQSGGDYCTFGYYEKNDVARALDYVAARQPNTVFGIWGNSLGGAIALQALAYDPRLRFGIVESTFARLRDVVHDYQSRLFHFHWEDIVEDGLQRAGELACFPPDSIQPAVVAKGIRQPVLMVHGDADRNIRIDYGRAIFDSLASTDKAFYTVAGADHYTVHALGGQAYKDTVQAFLARVTTQR